MERIGDRRVIWSKVKVFFEMIKFEHTVFALPFAYLGMLLARHTWPTPEKFMWITLAMVGARTAGMTLNRIADLKIDRQNPRTKNRAMVTGEFSVSSGWVVATMSLVIFFIAARMLNPLCFQLSFVAIVLLCGYHYVKRFSFLCHFALGLVLASAPIGGWIAVTGVFSWIPVFLAMAVLFWVAGFDILYGLQDFEFDKTHGLHSVPVKFGQTQALKISEYCHLTAIVFLIAFGVMAHLGVLYWAGAMIVAGLLKVEHYLVGDGNLSRINSAFFTINGWIGVLLLVFTFLEIFR